MPSVFSNDNKIMYTLLEGSVKIFTHVHRARAKRGHRSGQHTHERAHGNAWSTRHTPKGSKRPPGSGVSAAGESGGA